MNKVVLITGASSGIGYEFVKIFAKEHYDMVLVSRSEDKLRKIKKSIEQHYKVSVTVIPKDLSKKDAAQDVFQEVKNKGIHVEILINNAGFGDFGNFVDSNWNKQYEMVQLNIVALMQMTKCFMKPMIKEGHGRILNVASTAAFVPGPFLSNYYASKAFVLSFTEAVSEELKGSEVTITALCPGPTETGFVERADLGKSKLFRTLKVAKASDVAKYGYKNLMKGKTVAVHGIQNKALALGTKITPRNLIRNAMYQVQGEYHPK